MRVFYSFSFKTDLADVAALAEHLQERDYEPAIPIDRHIRVHNWRSRLAEALRKSDAAVVLITPENETNPYVMGELWAARVISQINPRFVLVPVLNRTGGIPEYVSDLYVANSRGGRITDFRALASEVDDIVKDNLAFEIAVSDTKPRVFIGHGQAEDWKKLATFLEKQLGLAVEEYEKNSAIGYTVTERLKQMLAASSVAIIVMSAEDEQQDESLRARQNVIHEIGLFQGRLGFEKVIVLRHETCESFSNISGINEIQYNAGNWEEVFTKIRHMLLREKLLLTSPLTPRSDKNSLTQEP
ncbi:MAG: nucleotide-binding protein [Chromatiales bacterium]|nr:nucleotide-binding protein [Chromatiales bacterium]